MQDETITMPDFKEWAASLEYGYDHVTGTPYFRPHDIASALSQAFNQGLQFAALRSRSNYKGVF